MSEPAMPIEPRALRAFAAFWARDLWTARIDGRLPRLRSELQSLYLGGRPTLGAPERLAVRTALAEELDAALVAEARRRAHGWRHIAFWTLFAVLAALAALNAGGLETALTTSPMAFL